MRLTMTIAQDWVLPLALWLVMFGIGLGLRLSDFRQVARSRRGFMLGAASMILVVPAIGIGLGILVAPPPPLLMGLVLLATTPGGILSNVLTDLLGGSVALSVSLSVFVSLVYVVTLPFIVQVALAAVMGQDASIRIPFASSCLHIVLVTLFPVASGMVFRAVAPRIAGQIDTAIKHVATLMLVVILVMIMVQQFGTLRRAFGQLMVVVLAMNALNVAWATVMCRMAGVGRPEARAVMVEHLIRQEATAIYVAVTLLGRDDMSLPLILNSFTGVIIGAVLVATLKKARALPWTRQGPRPLEPIL